MVDAFACAGRVVAIVPVVGADETLCDYLYLYVPMYTNRARNGRKETNKEKNGNKYFKTFPKKYD